MNKFVKLGAILRRMQSVLIAFSGGVDSSFLLKAAIDALGPENVLAVTALSETYPKSELSLSKKVAGDLKARHLVIRTRELQDALFRNNSLQRCYYCKKELFKRLNQIRRKKKIKVVADASTLSDLKDLRPGTKAKKEPSVRSPLQEAGLDKKDVRIYSKRLGLLTWDHPARACLASRIPYGCAIDAKILRKIENAENKLAQLGFRQLRVRDYGFLCRLEVGIQELKKAFTKRSEIIRRLKQAGYNYITLDLEGFRSGSLNEILNK